MPPLAVPSKFPSRSEPDLRAGVRPDASSQFRPKSLKEIGQPHPYCSGAIDKFRQDIRLHCFGDGVTEPLSDRSPRLDVRRTCSHVYEDLFEPLHGDALCWTGSSLASKLRTRALRRSPDGTLSPDFTANSIWEGVRSPRP